MNTDISRGANWNDFAGVEFVYDEAPIRVGESGAGSLTCPMCHSFKACRCELPNCRRNPATYAVHGCNVAGCIKHSNR